MHEGVGDEPVERFSHSLVQANRPRLERCKPIVGRAVNKGLVLIEPGPVCSVDSDGSTCLMAYSAWLSFEFRRFGAAAWAAGGGYAVNVGFNLFSIESLALLDIG